MFAGPFSRGPGRELGATMAASALSALGPNTVFFRTQTSSGVEEEIFVELDSESEWQTWVGAGMGARLYVMRDESDFKRVTIEQILSREDALRAAADAEATGTYLYLAGSTFEEDDKNLKNLERVRSSVAYGLEVETTRALAADESAEKEFGTLTALNDARAVTFVQKGKPGNILLEADGLCLNSKLVVLNEAKATPSSFDVNGLTKRGLLLKGILASPDDYETKPPEVKQQLEKFRDVRLVLSGYHFKEQVVIACAKPGPPIWIFRTVPARPLASKAPLAFEGTSDAESRGTGASKFVI